MPTHTDTNSPREGHSTMSTEEQVTTPSNEQPKTEPQYAVKVTLTGPGDPPEGVNPVRYVGPYLREWDALEAARTFERMATEAWRSNEVEVELAWFDPAIAHLDPYPPKDVDALAERIAAEPPVKLPPATAGEPQRFPVPAPRHVRRADPAAAWAFPSLRDRLVAAHGRNQAAWSWQHAIAILVANGGETRRPADDEDLEACRAAVSAASSRRVERFTPPTLDEAAQILHDLVAAASGHGLDRDDVTRQLAPFALDGAAARIAVLA